MQVLRRRRRGAQIPSQFIAIDTVVLMVNRLIEDDGESITTCWVVGQTLQEVFTAAANWAAEHDGVNVEGITLTTGNTGSYIDEEETMEYPHKLTIFYVDQATPLNWRR